MDILRAFIRRLKSLTHREQTSSEIREELEFHIQRQTEIHIAAGMSPESARHAAMREFGALGKVEEEMHETRGFSLVESVADDVAYAVRILRKDATFTIGAVATLALAIAATTTMFSVVNGVLLRPLPYPDSSRVLAVYEEVPSESSGPMTLSPANFLDLRDQSKSVAPMAIYVNSPLTVLAGNAQRIAGAYVTPELFAVLGVAPAHGRVFRAEEAQQGRDKIVVLGHRAAARYFGDPRSAPGKSIEIDRVRHQVVGVMPPGFAFPRDKTEMWLPFTFDPKAREYRGAHYLIGVGRLAPGVTLEHAQRELATIGARLEKQYPDTNKGVTMGTTPLQERRVGAARRGLLMLSAAVFVLAIIASVNVANLLLARASSREHEAAIRHALGAGRPRLVRQFLTEAAVLAFAGGVAGLIMAILGVRLIAAFGPRTIPRIDQISIDAPVLLFTLAITIVTSLAFGLIPAMRASGGGAIFAMLAAGGRRIAGRQNVRRLHAIFSAVQLALAVMLLAAAVLLLRSFQRVTSVPPGFDPLNVLTFNVGLPEEPYPNTESVNAFHDELLRRLRALPGVTSAGAATPMPLGGGGFGSSFSINGAEEEDQSVSVIIADRGFFQSLKIPLLRGRLFDDREHLGSERVLLISESAARRFFDGRDPIGATVKFSARTGYEKLSGTIIGIVADIHTGGLDQEVEPLFYAHRRQAGMTEVTIAMKTTVAPMSLASAVRRELAAVDRGVAADELETVESMLGSTLARRRFQTWLLAAFAFAALLIASIGVYAVIAYSVSQRTQEIGVRMTLGSSAARIFRLVLREATSVVIAGVAIGIGGALFLQRGIASLLFGIGANDPPTIAFVAAAVIGVALAAAAVPALRAMRVDPMIAIRQ